MTRFCACAATWFLFWRTVFQDWRLVKKSSSIDLETPEKAIISVFKSYLVHLGSFKRHILYFCASIVEKIRSHWGEPYEAKFVVVSVPTNGSNVAFNVVIWLSFLYIKVLQPTIYLWRIFFKRFLRCSFRIICILIRYVATIAMKALRVTFKHCNDVQRVSIDWATVFMQSVHRASRPHGVAYFIIARI